MGSVTDFDPKWRGVPISELDDLTLEQAFKQTLKILQAIILQLTKRGYFS